MTSGNVTRSESQRERERERIIQVFYSIKGTRRFDCTLRIDDAKLHDLLERALERISSKASPRESSRISEEIINETDANCTTVSA